MEFSGLDTKCVHSGNYVDPDVGGVNTPIYWSTSFIFPNQKGELQYPRYFNIPTQRAVADKIRALEGGDWGLVFSSGLAAVNAVFAAVLRSGDHAVFQSGLYGGTQHLVQTILTRFGVAHDIVDGGVAADFQAAIKPNTRLIFVESPTNPLLNVIDLAEIAGIGRKAGVLTVIDNTFATPINQNPIVFGFDIVMHSGTKYLNGHSDICCGALVGRGDLFQRILAAAQDLGGNLDPTACYLLERGLKTLGLRVARQNQNAQAIAEYLAGNPAVNRVYYPGLPNHPGHKIAAKQMRGFGGMLSFELDCDSEGARRFAGNLNLIKTAVSLGGVESLLCFPCETSHSKVSAEQRRKQGISDTLVRLSVGIENIEDLIADIDNALSKIR